jgi:hypothetical protein
MKSGARGVLLARTVDTITWARARVKQGMWLVTQTMEEAGNQTVKISKEGIP